MTIRPATPPLRPLRRVMARLERAAIAHALGGSGLCAALGLVDRVNDWDVACEAAPAELESLFSDRPHTLSGPGGCHADHKLELEDGGIELIARFAFFVPAGVVRIPTLVSGSWQGLPLGSPEAWATAYAIMGELEDSERRRERANVLFTHLDRHGSDAAVVARLLAEPLPASVAVRLRELPARR